MSAAEFITGNNENRRFHNRNNSVESAMYAKSMLSGVLPETPGGTYEAPHRINTNESSVERKENNAFWAARTTEMTVHKKDHRSTKNTKKEHDPNLSNPKNVQAGPKFMD